jgi:hypothetical protein
MSPLVVNVWGPNPTLATPAAKWRPPFRRSGVEPNKGTQSSAALPRCPLSRPSTSVCRNRPSVKHTEKAAFAGGFLYLNPYHILRNADVPLYDEATLYPTNLGDVSTHRVLLCIRSGGREPGKSSSQDDFRTSSRNFTYLCWVLPNEGEAKGILALVASREAERRLGNVGAVVSRIDTETRLRF